MFSADKELLEALQADKLVTQKRLHKLSGSLARMEPIQQALVGASLRLQAFDGMCVSLEKDDMAAKTPRLQKAMQSRRDGLMSALNELMNA